jgi:signal transduction histidine kinase
MDKDDLFELYKDCLVNNINIITLDSNQECDIYISNINNYDAADEILKDRLMKYISEEDIVENYQFYNSYDSNVELEYIEMFGKLKTNHYFMIRTPVNSVNESVDILNKFMVYSFGACFLIAIAFVIFFSDILIKPINKLCQLSIKISNLQFDEKYNETSNKEIDLLGHNLNNLSESLEEALNKLTETNLKLEEELKQKIEIDEMRKDFISNVSHELKTPLQIIRGYSEGLMDCDEEDRDFYCEVIVDESKKMNDMVVQLINLNQIEFGSVELCLENIDIVELTKGVIQNLDLIIKDKGVNIEYYGPESLIAYIDEFKMTQIITNYLTNALNHIDGEKIIKVKFEEVDEKIKLSVFNTGNNIPDDELDKIWIKFYKVDKARTREYGGSGIGLSIVAAIMKIYDEEYGVLNRDDGVEFYINLKKKI